VSCHLWSSCKFSLSEFSKPKAFQQWTIHFSLVSAEAQSQNEATYYLLSVRGLRSSRCSNHRPGSPRSSDNQLYGDVSGARSDRLDPACSNVVVEKDDYSDSSNTSAARFHGVSPRGCNISFVVRGHRYKFVGCDRSAPF
jgi:hypothetical protein